MLAPSFSVVLSAHAFKSDKLGKSWGYVRRRSLEQPSAAAAASRSPRSEFPVVEPVRPSGPVPALAPQYRWTVSRHHEHLTRQALKNGVHIASDNVNFPIKSNFNRPAAAADPLHKEEAKARPKVEKTVNMTFNLLVGNSIPTANLSDEFAVAHAASLSANVVNLTNAEDDLLLSVFAKVIWQAAAHHLKWFKSKAALVKGFFFFKFHNPHALTPIHIHFISLQMNQWQRLHCRKNFGVKRLISYLSASGISIRTEK